MTQERAPIRSTILLYLARLAPGQVTWGRQLADDIKRTKFGKLSAGTAYKVLEEFHNCGLLELLNPPKESLKDPMNASLTKMSWTELKREKKMKQLLRAGWPEDEILELEKKYYRQPTWLADLSKPQITQLILRKKSTGFTPPDPRAKCYRLSSDGKKVAELLKQNDLLTQWWPSRNSPTDSTDFVRQLSARLGDYQAERTLQIAKNCKLLRIEEGEPELRPRRYSYELQILPSQTLTQPITRMPRHRYRLT